MSSGQRAPWVHEEGFGFIEISHACCKLFTGNKNKYQKIRRTGVIVHQQNAVMNIVLLMYSICTGLF